MTTAPQTPVRAGAAAAYASHRVRLDDGRSTTVHVAGYPRDSFAPAVIALEAPEALHAWCRRSGVDHALVGGFFVTPGGPALGELWVDGLRRPSVPFDAPHGTRRSCVHLVGDEVRFLPLGAIDPTPTGSLLQAGPALVAGGHALIREGDDPEGFSAGHAQFDSDITAGRHPRAALGEAPGMLLAVATEGRAPDEAGLTLAELARVMVDLGATAAINLDGGGSVSLVVDGLLRNRPRSAEGDEIAGGRPLLTAIAFHPRPQAAAATSA